MILDRLVLHDFGQYRGRHEIELTPPTASKPVVLFGGLNGAGKTTLLEAIQLCFFGVNARLHLKVGNYEEYLFRCINRAQGTTAASVEITFRHVSNGQEHRYRVVRSWRASARGCKEDLQVYKDGSFAPVLVENWHEQAEEFLPSRIAHLFLFDGEKVEAYADPATSAALIETAIHNLLGLDVVEKLGSDLVVLERRKKLEVQTKETQTSVDEAEARLSAQMREVERFHQAAAMALTQLKRAELAREEAEAKYRLDGGHLLERRDDIEAQYLETQRRVESIEKQMRELAATALPLALCRPLIERTLLHAHEEAKSELSLQVIEALEERDLKLIQFLREVAPEAATQLETHLESDRADRQPKDVERYLDLSGGTNALLNGLLQSEVPTALDEAASLAEELGDARAEFEAAKTRLAAVPTPDALQGVIENLQHAKKAEDALNASHAALVADLERSRRQLESAKAEVDKLHQASTEAAVAQGDLFRLLQHSERVRKTLGRFRDAVIGRHLKRIEALILDSFQQLVRKENLVHSLLIDRDTFQLRLATSGGSDLTPERLSAGERQLLAVSVLWGLARASGRPLPTVVDTPLGRLDSIHRRKLVSNYFPNASHQVVLLSTDEEISGDYLSVLAPHVGRSYQIVFDDKLGSARVEEGYFKEEERALVA